MPKSPVELPSAEVLSKLFTFRWTDGSDGHWRTSPSRQGSGQLQSAATYRLGIYRDDVLVGVARRKVATSASVLSVDHLTLDLNGPDAKGKGFSNAFWVHSLTRYQELGVDQVFITAADEGRTFWAREPFRFGDPRRPRGLIDAWCRPGTEEPAGRDAFREHATGLGFSSDDIQRFVEGVDENPSSYTPGGLYASELGRLLLSGATWRGVADLRAGQLTA